MSAAGAETDPLPSDTSTKVIVEQARQLGLLSGSAAGEPGQDGSTLDLAEIVDRAIARSSSDDAARTLAIAAGLLLSELASGARGDASALGLLASARIASPAFDQVKADYAAKFKAASIRTPRPGEADFRPEIARAARLITGPSARARYDDVAATTKVPWYAIAAIHNREASLNFAGHLHNGDPLTAKTVDVPAGGSLAADRPGRLGRHRPEHPMAAQRNRRPGRFNKPCGRLDHRAYVLRLRGLQWFRQSRARRTVGLPMELDVVLQ